MLSNKTSTLVIVLMIVAVGALVFLCGKYSEHVFKIGYPHTRVDIAGTSFMLAIASTPSQRQLGLSYTRHMPARAGMIFVFEKEEQHPFWMKDMHFPLDIIWVDGDLRIVHVEHALDPSTYPANFDAPVPSQYVIELSAGIAEALDVENGDGISFSSYISKSR